MILLNPARSFCFERRETSLETPFGFDRCILIFRECIMQFLSNSHGQQSHDPAPDGSSPGLQADAALESAVCQSIVPVSPVLGSPPLLGPRRRSAGPAMPHDALLPSPRENLSPTSHAMSRTSQQDPHQRMWDVVLYDHARHQVVVANWATRELAVYRSLDGGRNFIRANSATRSPRARALAGASSASSSMATLTAVPMHQQRLDQSHSVSFSDDNASATSHRRPSAGDVRVWAGALHRHPSGANGVGALDHSIDDTPHAVYDMTRVTSIVPSPHFGPRSSGAVSHDLEALSPFDQDLSDLPRCPTCHQPLRSSFASAADVSAEDEYVSPEVVCAYRHMSLMPDRGC